MTFKPSFWQKFLSWIYPFCIEKVDSEVSGKLEVNLQYGQIAIDSPKANYSFGNLHLVFREALSSIPYNFSKQYKVLILGFGAGSIVHILRNEIGIRCGITGVELDEAMIKLSKKYYPRNLFHNTKIHLTDAYEFMKTNTDTYDLVCVDLFIDTSIPNQFQTAQFLIFLKNALHESSYLFMNSMQGNQMLKEHWLDVFGTEEKIEIQENEVMFYHKK